MKKACGKAHLKTILAVGELGSLENIYNASMVTMFAGSDFIKTSTGNITILGDTGAHSFDFQARRWSMQRSPLDSSCAVLSEITTI
jgi:deoxyribose-phosphate aldolase